jgi:hypothetical protein
LLVKFIREARLSARGASAGDSALALAAAFHAGDEALVQILLHETEQQEGRPFSLRTSGLPIDLAPAFQAGLITRLMFTSCCSFLPVSREAPPAASLEMCASSARREIYV